MSIQLISVSYQYAPLSIREKFSFSREEQAKIMERLVLTKEVEECILISTCNRTELYCYGNDQEEKREVFAVMQKLLLNAAGLTKEGKASSYLRFFQDQKASHHLFQVAAGLDSMVIGEDQILGQVKDAKHKAVKDRHCGKILDAIFTKAIHVGQVVRNKTNINKGSVSIGSAAIDLAEKYIGDLENKSVLVIGAGKMGKLVAKALAEKDLNAIFVANRTYYVAVDLAKDLGGEAILFNDLEKYLATADLVISATSAPHPIITKERLLKSPRDYESLMLIDIANPRDISEDVLELGVKSFNIDNLREIAEINTNLRKKEFAEAENIINDEFILLKESFKIMKVDELLGNLRASMEYIRERETQKAIGKLSDVDGSDRILDNLTNSIVNKIFYDVSKKVKKAAKDENEDILAACEYIFN